MERETIIDSMQVLEEQIREQEKITAKLKRARNSLLKVSKLPPEVLGNIFHLNVALKEPFGGIEEGSYSILLVCHHWFDVASRTPELWAFWGNNLEDWEERHPNSSVGVPLDLVLDELTPTFGNFSESQRMALENRAARDNIRRVHLQSDWSHRLTSIITSLTSPSGGLRTNSLESLILSNEDSETVDVSFFAHSRLLKLRHLELVGCTIPSWDHLTSQTTLLATLKLFCDNASPTPTTPQLLSILASNPHLQNLELTARAIPDDGDGLSYQVPLHQLEELRLDGSVGQVFGLLRRLEYPKNMDDLSLNLSRCAIGDISQTIGPYIRDYLRRRGKSPNGLGLSLSFCGFILFRAGDASRPCPSQSGRMAPFLYITISMDQVHPHQVWEALTLDLIAHTPREEIVHFRACGTHATVEDLRVQMPNLETLELFRVPLYAAFPTPDSMIGPDVQERFPPSLEHLSLEQLLANGCDWVPLIAFLFRRVASGNQLDSLRIVGPCHMCWPVTQSVKAMVRKFDIDDGCLKSWCPFGTCL